MTRRLKTQEEKSGWRIEDEEKKVLKMELTTWSLLHRAQDSTPVNKLTIYFDITTAIHTL